jgi:hypothetical protein
MLAMSGVSTIIKLLTKKGTKMDETIKELFDLYHAGEIDVFELQETLEMERFDGDIFDYL